jgi:hypothetical protein
MKERIGLKSYSRGLNDVASRRGKVWHLIYQQESLQMSSTIRYNILVCCVAITKYLRLKTPDHGLASAWLWCGPTASILQGFGMDI